MKQKVSNLAELKENGMYIIEDDEISVENYIPQVLKEKGLNPSDLAKLTGISRQNINAVIRNNRPGIDFVLKVSFVLGEPIDRLFKLTDTAWVKPLKGENESPVFIDILNMEIVDNTVRRKVIKETGKEYFNKETKATYSTKEYNKMMKEYVDSNKKDREQLLSENSTKMSKTRISSLAVEELKKEFANNYSKLYKKLGQKMDPYPLNTQKRW